MPTLLIFFKFDQLYKLSDNATKFKNKLFVWITFTLEIKQVSISSYNPWANGWIENVHNLHKTYIQKHVSSVLARDKVIQYSLAAYNFVPDEHSKETAFFLMFGWGTYIQLV